MLAACNDKNGSAFTHISERNPLTTLMVSRLLWNYSQWLLVNSSKAALIPPKVVGGFLSEMWVKCHSHPRRQSRRVGTTATPRLKTGRPLAFCRAGKAPSWSESQSVYPAMVLIYRP